MGVLVCAFIDRKDKADSESRLHLADGLEIDADRRISKEAVVSGAIVVQSRFTFQFKNGDEFQDARQGQLPVRDGISEDETVFEGLQTARIAGTKDCGMSENGLNSQVGTQPRV